MSKATVDEIATGDKELQAESEAEIENENDANKSRNQDDVDMKDVEEKGNITSDELKPGKDEKEKISITETTATDEDKNVVEQQKETKPDETATETDADVEKDPEKDPDSDLIDDEEVNIVNILLSIIY